MYYYMIGKIVTNNEGTYIRNAVVRQYSYAPAVTSVITDYIVASHSTVSGPFIVGKININSDAQKNLLAKSLTGTVSFDKLKNYQSLFVDGFTIDSNYKTEAEINEAFDGKFKINGSRVLWNVTF